MFIQRAKAQVKSFMRGDFVRDEEGVIAIEAMIIMPMMFWTFMCMFSIFDAFRSYSMNQKAAFTIGDAISRETQPIDAAYLDGMWSMFDYLAETTEPSSLRVTSLYFDGAANTFRVDWSQSRGSEGGFSDANFSGTTNTAYWRDRLPVIPANERIMLVETWDNYDPPFETGLEQEVIHNSVFTRPRYAPRVCWQVCN
jgi:hypothetical protein